MTLKQNKTCPHSSKCKYSSSTSGDICQGTNPSRKTVFQCEFVDDNGNVVSEGYVRSSHDVTGKMKIILEGN